MTTNEARNSRPGLTPAQQAAKRVIDVVAAILGLVAVGWLVVLAAIAARRDTGASGIFCQWRIGRKGRLFRMYKIRTMRVVPGMNTTVTTAGDCRITRMGAILRRWKIDELPQLINVLRGEMSLVGPRPEVPRYLEQIRETAPMVLQLQPGITGPASLKYRHEERLLACQPKPDEFNDCVIFPDKLRINEAYLKSYSLATDFKILWWTLFSVFHDDDSRSNLRNAQLPCHAA